MSAVLTLATKVIDAYNRHDLAEYQRLHAADAWIRFAGGPGEIGLESWLPMLSSLFTALPDLTIRPVTMLADDTTAVLEIDQRGTHTGVLVLDDFDRQLLDTDVDAIPPTGRSVDVSGVVVLAVVDGCVRGERHHWPPYWLYEQLGLLTLSAMPIVRS